MCAVGRLVGGMSVSKPPTSLDEKKIDRDIPLPAFFRRGIANQQISRLRLLFFAR
jgi:hypothetical protein